jgi:putative solute:sodium symporter small subunit
MENSTNDYHISFFKPTTPQAKANRNMVLWLVSIWFVAIFGFQLLLRLIEEPTPEPIYTAFTQSWEQINKPQVSPEDYQVLGQASLSVLGKIFVTAEEKAILQNTLAYSVHSLTDASQQAELAQKLQAFDELKASIDDIHNPSYQAGKRELSMALAPLLGLDQLDVRSELLPIELSAQNIEELTEETKAQLPLIMKKYLIHNQSFLTDFKFLGFPFHYFYTAVFLLILFVGLCLIYCVRTDRMNARLNIAD